MAEIGISLSKQNFKALIKHVFIGNWILTASKTEADSESDQESKKLLDLMLSLAKNYGVMDEISYDDRFGQYSLTDEKEQEYIAAVDDFQDDVFWEDLISKLAERDALAKAGEKKWRELVGPDRAHLIWDEKTKYYQEFEKNGLARLRIVK